MNINDFILNEIKELGLKDTVSSAQDLFKNLPITHIPVIENGKLIGCLPESDIQTIENKNGSIKEYDYLLDHFYTNERATLLDLVTLFADNDCNLIPVLNNELNYVGYYELGDILDAFADSPFLHLESETLIIQKGKSEHSMSQISQIVESNNGKLLGMYMSHEGQDNIQVTLKVSSTEINEIIQTFRRYDYTVVTQHDDDFYIEELKDRARYLRKYLDM
ncbi:MULTISPECIES: CBS domain-containing protein [Tenacibaculum]|uniref:CBS domain-containing protein n=1 Tax=Tenacibaculum TaxID=104267 RepID=UPI000898E487|nr:MULTISPECIES: CBS domain-containing protein [unclassified Tenacibaculum]RBW57296.1 CBS domain-containing protein [Tenacibaculum sp. E3R01]SEE23801.1 CBS domain-containing protein [Tenacibaculum sp. MAR_2010_89]